MKNVKQIALGLVVGAMAIGFSSFTNGNKKQVSDWYLPNGTIAASSPAAQHFSNYLNSPQNEPTNCGSGTTNVCAAEFPNTGSAPTNIDTKN